MAVPGCQQGSAPGSVTQMQQPCGAQVCKCRCLPQHLKKSREMEAEMLYGSAPRTPIKRRMLSPHAPAKVSKVKCPCRAVCWAGLLPASLGLTSAPGRGVGRAQGAAAPWEAVLCDVCSAFSSAPWHLQCQHHTQHHCSHGLWGTHLPLAHISAATLWEEGEEGPGESPCPGLGWKGQGS